MRSEAMENEKFSTRVGNKTQNLYVVSANRYLMTVLMYNFDRARVFCVCSNFLHMTTEHAYTGQPITLPELSLKIRVFELGNFHWKLDFRGQGALALIRPPTNFAVHGAPWARILNHVVGSFWLDSVLLTEGSILDIFHEMWE